MLTLGETGETKLYTIFATFLYLKLNKVKCLVKKFLCKKYVLFRYAILFFYTFSVFFPLAHVRKFGEYLE